MSFSHIHAHNEFSYLDGLGSSNDYASRAKDIGFEYLAITNHGNVDGCIKFQNSCINNGIKPLIGCEIYVVSDINKKEKGEKRKHLVVFAKNNIGWENILKMLTVANIDGFYYRPRLDPKVIMEHSEGLVFSSACTASVITCEWGIDLFNELKLSYPEDVFLEIMPHKMTEQIALNEIIIKFCKDIGVAVVASNDCHYVNKGDNLTQEVLLAIQSKKKWNDKTRWKFSIDDLYLKTRNEMMRSFREQGCLPVSFYREAIENTELLAERCCDFIIPKKKVDLPIINGMEKYGDNDVEILTALCKIGFDNKINNKDVALYKARMDEELSLIIELGFERYFIIVWELISWCKNNDILTGPGRGSVGGSLAAYLLGITTVDPIEHGLIFARFISPARIDLPDIDMDFEDIKRPMIFKHFQEIYGVNNVAGASTFSTMKGRGALHDVARVFDVPLVDVNKASKSIVVRCIDGDSLLYTKEGPKKIKSLVGRRNIRIASHGQSKREMRKVLEVFSNEKIEMFNLVLESGKKIICSAEHRLWSKYKYKYRGEIKTKIGWRKLVELNQDTDEILSYDFDEIYFNCLQCNKLVYRERNKNYSERKFCSLSCLTTYKNFHDNPMHKEEIKIKNGKSKSDSLKNHPETHPFRIMANKKKSGVFNNCLLHNKLIEIVKKVFQDFDIEEEFRIKQHDGKHYWFIDAAVPEFKLAFEYDGSQHKTMENIFDRDIKRDKQLIEKYWTVFRFTKQDVDGIEEKIMQIKRNIS